MTVESATYIDTLDPTLPLSGDPKSEGDNHLRLIKQVLQNTFPNLNGSVTPTEEQLNVLSSVFNAKNMVINPHGTIIQDGSSGVTTNGAYLADQWVAEFNASGAGFISGVGSGTVSAFDPNYILFRTTTAKASLAAGDFAFFTQRFEGLVFRKLLYGSSAARASYIRFRASATQAATAALTIRNEGAARSYVVPFDVTTVPTDYSFLIPGDTGGSWVVSNGTAATLSFCFAAGTTFQTSTLGAWQAGNFLASTTQSNQLDTVNRELRVTDVQWTDSNILLPFQGVDAGLELLRCERYFQAYSSNGLNTYNQGPNLSLVTLPLRTAMRVAPVLFNASVSGYVVENATTNLTSMFLDRTDTSLVQVGYNGSGGPAQGTSGRYLVGSGIKLSARM